MTDDSLLTVVGFALVLLAMGIVLLHSDTIDAAFVVARESLWH